MNSTEVPNGLVPPLLLIGEVPKISELPYPIFSANTWLIARSVASAKFETATVKKCFNIALPCKTSAANRDLFVPRQSVYEYRKMGDYGQALILLVFQIKRSVFVDLGDRGEAKQFNMLRVNPYSFHPFSTFSRFQNLHLRGQYYSKKTPFFPVKQPFNNLHGNNSFQRF